MCHNPQKAHLHLLGVLHVQYEKNPPSGLQSYGPDKNITLTPWGTRSWGQMSHFPQKAHLDPLGVLHVQYEKNPPSAYRVMARTRIFTWANKHITLTPWGSSFSGSNASQPTKGTSTPPWGSYVKNPPCAVIQEYSLEKNPPGGYRVTGSNASQPTYNAHLTPPGGPTCAI